MIALDSYRSISTGVADGYEARDLTGVYFGLRMREGHKIAIGALLANTPTKFFRMVAGSQSR